MNNSIGGVTNRKKSALSRLENQLISGVKTAKSDVAPINGYKHHEIGALPLTEQDIIRVNKEISVLKTRI